MRALPLIPAGPCSWGRVDVHEKVQCAQMTETDTKLLPVRQRKRLRWNKRMTAEDDGDGDDARKSLL